jgi:hypothetical protein
MRKKFTAYNKDTGQVLFGGTADNPEVMATESSVIVLDVEYTDGYLVDGVHHALPPQPSEHHVFNYTTKQWDDPRTLADLKAAQWELIKQARSNAEYAGFTWDGSVFDSDAISQNRSTGAGTLAQLSPGFTIDWTLADNSVRTLNQADMIAVGVALGVHVQTQFARAQGLRLQIEAASTPGQVAAVVW